MGRPKIKESVPISFKIDAAVLNAMNRYAGLTGVPKTYVMEQAVMKYLAEKMPEEFGKGV